MNYSNNSKQAGFTLVEIAVALAILAIIVGAGFSTLGAHIDNANQRHTMGSLEITKRALLDYVAVNKHMPCPDTDNDGEENRSGNACASSVGTVPFNDIGLGVGIASDDWGNVFGYGINKDATVLANMQNQGNSASYFSNVSNTEGEFPAFRLSTPPTATNPSPSVPGVAQSYTVCKKDVSTCSNSDSSVIEVNSIPAVLVAFNENGSSTSLSACNGESGKEAVNCTDNLLLWKSVFSPNEYDDQIATISGYEIKQQVDLVEFTVTVDSKYAGYDLIVRDDVSNANTTNLGTNADEAFYVDTDDNGDGGNFDANVQMKDGDDKVYVTKDVTAAGKIDMGAGNDEITIVGSILNDGKVILGTGTDKAWIGGVEAGGYFDAGADDDDVTVYGVIAGDFRLGDENDTLILEGGSITSTATVDGGNGNDWIEVNQTKAEFDAGQLDYVTGFEWIRFNDNTFDTIPYSSP